MRLRMMQFVFVVVASLLLSSTVWAQSGVTTQAGTLPDGATYLIEVPSNWNGILFLYSHGYVAPGSKNPALDVGDPLTRFFMLSSGFALAGSSYATTGWAIEQALPDQIAVLDIFDTTIGKPSRTIAWGHSLGGMITAGLIQRHPDRFDAALPMCGVLSGGVATWNTALDSAFAFQTLLAPPHSPLQVVNIANPGGNFLLARAILDAAQATPQGRARLALVSAFGDGPGWFDPLSPEPAPTDFVSQEMNQYLWDRNVDFPFAFALRAELEFRAKGNPSWNTHVDYRRQLEHSIDAAEVRALYEQAGLDLDTDLEKLNETVRISADPQAKEYLEQNIIYNGDIHIPVLTLHTTGDGLVVVENESAYSQVVREDGNGQFLRRTFVSRAGHCTFTPAETIAAVQTLLARLETGKWPDVDAANLNAAATALLPVLSVPGVTLPPPAFVDFKPHRYLRPFDGEAEECEPGTSMRRPLGLPWAT
ncbi:MAG TPA: prolyl oligopeptidase family serine peptidase [Candidatus Acidoferrum sp.]|nr:prolyl oligopeptidase family serine peptidase [Candidatus Acidoferrum sp.]